ncbi:MAG TPA: MotA/TolQ/ExbB proton channel family protein [Gammaproteobacteria bacterium]|nr:MotA/TolQ/ExbB proton channel family protein [Gammaproteobacteria bacterium]
MLEIVRSGGWMMLPIILASIIAAGIIIERLWSLQSRRVVPEHLLAKVWHLLKSGELGDEEVRNLYNSSPLGRVLATGLIYRGRPREIIKEMIEDTGRHVTHELERYLNTLGTIAAISPLLGLLGTVVGMIEVFSVITVQGVGDPGALAGGISQALITTAAGLVVAIPSLVAYRYLRGRVKEHVVKMEQEAIKLVEALQGVQS